MEIQMKQVMNNNKNKGLLYDSTQTQVVLPSSLSGDYWITGSVLMIIFQDRQSINVNETSNELS